MKKRKPQLVTMRVTLFEKIEILRARKHWTQTDLSRMARISRATLSMIKRGKAHPEAATLAAIWKALRGKQ
jgi:transcriptional regulator with XRE-family HTH domain